MAESNVEADEFVFVVGILCCRKQVPLTVLWLTHLKTVKGSVLILTILHIAGRVTEHVPLDKTVNVLIAVFCESVREESRALLDRLLTVLVLEEKRFRQQDFHRKLAYITHLFRKVGNAFLRN